MKYEIIKTGATGNATILEDIILIDCGVPFKAILDHYRRLKIVLLTHIHTDHFSRRTIKKLARERPTLRWVVPPWLISEIVDTGVSVKTIDVVNIGNTYEYEGFSLSPVELFHSVPNCGYKVTVGDKKAIYATDTNRVDHLEAIDFDLYLIEANFVKAELLERIKTKEENNEFCYEYQVLKDHLSMEDAENFIYKNIGSKGIYVYMHSHKKKSSILEKEC